VYNLLIPTHTHAESGELFTLTSLPFRLPPPLYQRRYRPFLPQLPLVGRLLWIDSSSAGNSATTVAFSTASTSSSGAAASPALWPRTTKLVDGILAGSRTALSRAITLGEWVHRFFIIIQRPERGPHGGTGEGDAVSCRIFSWHEGWFAVVLQEVYRV